MAFPMYVTQYPQGYGYPTAGYPSAGYPGAGYPTAGYPSAGYPGAGYPTYPTQPGASAGGTDPNAILGAVIQPLMSLVMSLLTGAPAAPAEEPVCPEPGADPGNVDPETPETTLGPDSETDDYLEVLNDKSNALDLKDLEEEYGDGVSDGKLTAEELENIVDAIEKGKKGTEDISEDLKIALTWLDQDDTGQAVMINLSNEFDEDGNAAINIKNGFDEDNIDDVEDLEDEELEPYDAYEALTYLKDDQDFADRINGDDTNLTLSEIDDALQSKDYTAEEKAVLRMLRSNYDGLQELWNFGEEGFSTDGSEKGALTTALNSDQSQLEALG